MTSAPKEFYQNVFSHQNVFSYQVHKESDDLCSKTSCPIPVGVALISLFLSESLISLARVLSLVALVSFLSSLSLPPALYLSLSLALSQSSLSSLSRARARSRLSSLSLALALGSHLARSLARTTKTTFVRANTDLFFLLLSRRARP